MAQSSPGTLPRLVTFLGQSMALGFATGFVFTAALILFDIGGLKRLLESSPDAVLAIALLYALNALTFGGLAMGVAVMTLPRD